MERRLGLTSPSRSAENFLTYFVAHCEYCT